MGYKFVKLNELRYESYHAPGRAQHLRALLVMVDDIEKAVLGRGSCGWSQHEIVRVQVLEEVDSAGVEVVVAPHLDELSARVNAHLLVPVTLHDNHTKRGWVKFAQNVGYKFVKLSELWYESYHAPGRA